MPVVQKRGWDTDSGDDSDGERPDPRAHDKRTCASTTMQRATAVAERRAFAMERPVVAPQRREGTPPIRRRNNADAVLDPSPFQLQTEKAELAEEEEDDSVVTESLITERSNDDWNMSALVDALTEGVKRMDIVRVPRPRGPTAA